MNETLKALLDEGNITQNEYDILFCDKKDWFTVNAEMKQNWDISKEKQSLFSVALSKVLKLQEKADTYDCSYIIFPVFTYKEYSSITTKNISFLYAIFMGEANFGYAKFQGRVTFVFVNFTEKANFYGVLFNDNVNFMNTNFYKEANFNAVKFSNNFTTFVGVTFIDGAIFQAASFIGTIDFTSAVSMGKINFVKTSFTKDVEFQGTYFISEVNFKGAEFKGLNNFSNLSFQKINLEYVRFTEVTLLHLSGIKASCSLQNKTIQHIQEKNFEEYSKFLQEINTIKEENKEPLSKVHFANKETARLIKANFEKQNNISEANKYFSIEQELYIDHLHKTKTEPNRIPTLATLYLNKWVSDFGTDWIRSLFFLFVLSYLFMRLYINLDGYLGTDEHIEHFTEVSDIQYIWTMLVSWGLIYLSTFFKSEKLIFWILLSFGIITGLTAIGIYDNVLAMQNYIIQLTNPINAFKNMNLYEGIEIYGAIVRITVITIMYQFIVAFRQNTRRK